MGTFTTAQALRHALPYLRLYQGQIFVVKASGSVFESKAGMLSLFEQISVLHRVGIGVIFVHGGGAQTTAIAKTMGVEPRFAGGRRVTCAQTLDAAAMAMRGTIGARAVAAFRGLQVPAVGVSGVDGGLIVAHRRPPVEVDGETVDYGFVGDIDSVDVTMLRALSEARFVPVVNPLCADAEGQLLNVNADTVAATLAGALGAAKLILLTEGPGILDDPDDLTSLVSLLDLAGLDRLVADGKARAGMRPKVAAIDHALNAGVPKVHVVSWRSEDSLLTEIFTNEGEGTMVVPHLAAEEGLASEAGV